MSKCCWLRVGFYMPATARVNSVVVVGYLVDPQAADHQRHLYRLQATGGTAARRFAEAGVITETSSCIALSSSGSYTPCEPVGDKHSH